MRYKNVCIESFGYVVPEEVVTSEQLEARLEPIYTRLRLPSGRLELMTGIRERRFWPRGTMPSDVSVESCRLALEAAEISSGEVGAIIHGSVCRDFLEPATCCSVHHRLNLPTHCVVYDTSNACLGILNGMLQAANMIELGQIRAALIVGSEGGRQLVENTVATLNADLSMTRKQIKMAVASLTIGSASCAILLTHRDISRTNNSLVGAAVLANTDHHELCHSGQDEAGDQMKPLMTTDSEQLMKEGVETGVMTFSAFQRELGWETDSIERTVCHQVGAAHRKLMLESLELDPANDFATFPWLGNTGSAALPSAMAASLQCHPIENPTRIAMLGIGSGINCIMAGVDWQTSRVASATLELDGGLKPFDPNDESWGREWGGAIQKSMN